MPLPAGKDRTHHVFSVAAPTTAHGVLGNRGDPVPVRRGGVGLHAAYGSGWAGSAGALLVVRFIHAVAHLIRTFQRAGVSFWLGHAKRRTKSETKTNS